MRSTEEHAAINRMLQSHGLGRLEDGAGLVSQLGFMVQDHEHLRSLLVRCEPENRSAMYDSLKPYLRFTPKALDVYIAESAERAANQDLPTIDSAGNINFSPAPTYEMTPDVESAETAVNETLAKHVLTVTCRSCTKQEQFTGGVRGRDEANRPATTKHTPPRPATSGPRMVTSMSRVAPRPARSERRRNMAGNLESIEIFPSENGGHRVVHNFKREAGKKAGAMGGGVYMERPKPGEHFFGKGQEGDVLPHVGKALNLPLGAGKPGAE